MLAVTFTNCRAASRAKARPRMRAAAQMSSVNGALLKQVAEKCCVDGGWRFFYFPFFFFWRWILPSTQVERATRILFVLRTSADNAAASVTLIVRPIASARFVSCKFHGLPAALARKWGGGSPLFRVGRAQRPVSLARKPREINLIRYRLLTISSTGNEFRKICSYFFFFFHFARIRSPKLSNTLTNCSRRICLQPPSM